MTDVSFNDVLLFSRMPHYFELKLEVYSHKLEDKYNRCNKYIEYDYSIIPVGGF